MPNRMLYTTLLTSEKVSGLDSDTFELYIRLLLVVDDFGRYVGNPVRISRACWPDREDKTGAKILPLIQKLCKSGLLILYEVDNEKYIQLTKWSQRTRQAESKFPAQSDICPSNDRQMTDACPSSAHVDVDVDVDVDERRISAKRKHKYGEYDNVLLTDEELEKLKDKFSDYEKKIQNLSEGIELKGYVYKSHYLAILKWAGNEKTSGRPNAQTITERMRDL